MEIDFLLHSRWMGEDMLGAQGQKCQELDPHHLVQVSWARIRGAFTFTTHKKSSRVGTRLLLSLEHSSHSSAFIERTTAAVLVG